MSFQCCWSLIFLSGLCFQFNFKHFFLSLCVSLSVSLSLFSISFLYFYTNKDIGHCDEINCAQYFYFFGIYYNLKGYILSEYSCLFLCHNILVIIGKMNEGLCCVSGATKKIPAFKKIKIPTLEKTDNFTQTKL